MAAGVAILDVDNDGWMDVFFVNGARLTVPHLDGKEPDKSAPKFWNRLFRNNTDGTFSDVTVEYGVQGRGYGMGVAAGDYDNDGDADLFIANFSTDDHLPRFCIATSPARSMSTSPSTRESRQRAGPPAQDSSTTITTGILTCSFATS